MTAVAASPDLAALYAAHRHALVRMAVLLVDDLASAEDVVKDAFVAFHRNAGRIYDPQAALGYLRVCVVNGARPVILAKPASTSSAVHASWLRDRHRLRG